MPGMDSKTASDADLAARLFALALADVEPRQALSALCSLCKKKRAAQAINLHPDRTRLPLLLKHEDAKVRKNAARLIGELGLAVDAPFLRDALFDEQTYFIVPSVILALGALDARDDVLAYKTELAGRTGIDPKQLEDIRTAIDAVLTSGEQAAFNGLSQPRAFELSAPRTADILHAEALAHGMDLQPANDMGRITTDDYASLFTLRCFDEALMPVASGVALPSDPTKSTLRTWAAQIASAAVPFTELIEGTLGKGVGFRIELRGAAHSLRGPICRAVANKLSSSSTLVNSTSDYAAELRITLQQAVTLLHAKLYLPPDDRFAYRTMSLPASIAPHTAAALLRFALPHLSAGARVLDPCCGSATLLIERQKLLGCAALCGVDNAREAILAATANAKAAGVPMQLHLCDALMFSPPSPFDEILCNLPFGSRVGTGDSTQRLYAGLFDRMDKLLAPGGVAVLYTTQHMPLLRIASAHGFGVVAQHRFEAGGLQPHGIIFKRTDQGAPHADA